MNKTNIVWFIDFINLKIDETSDSEKLKWISDAIYMLEFGRPSVSVRAYPIKEKIHSPKKIAQWERDGKLEKCQMKLKDFFETIKNSIDKTIAAKKEWMPQKKFRFGHNFASFETNIKVTVQAIVSAGVKWKIVNEGKKNEEVFHRIDGEELVKKRLHVSYYSINDEESLLMRFCQVLEGIPIESLRRCPECGNWFLHLSKREKVFCSHTCASRQDSRRRRQKIRKDDPKTYKEQLVQGAKRARKSYEKKQKAKNPKAIIGRRPTKHKDI
jgi:hypothetical protein